MEEKFIDIVYDIETFPNFWCCTFYNTETQKVSVFTICWELGIDERTELREYLTQPNIRLVGYNNLYYDYPILAYVHDYDGKKINEDIYEMSNSIIGNRSSNKPHRVRSNFEWPQLDLMKMMAFDKVGVGLKQISVNLNWHKIQDLPLHYDHNVTREEIELVHKYNLNDVMISYKLYLELQPQITLRVELKKLYNVDLTSASDSKIADELLTHFYTEAGVDVNAIKYLRTKREMLWLRDCIAPNIEFKTQKLRDLKHDIESTLVVSENNYAYKKKLEFGNCRYELGIGGLHSVDDPGIFSEDDNYVIRDIDFSSYYPSMIIMNKLVPAHLDENFTEILNKITQERLLAKKSGDKIKADALKITINSIFGKMGSDTFWLYDPKCFLSVTVSGQLYLLMLIELLVLNGITVISANTDGIVSRVPRNLYDKFQQIAKDFEQIIGIGTEETPYKKYIRTDVNNYITIKTDGKTKEKGRYVKDTDLKKGYRYPIIPEAIYEYFVHDVPVEETLRNCKDILKFCISQKSGDAFKIVLRKDDVDNNLQKTNRFFISTNGGKLLKIDKNDPDRIAGLFVDNLVTILNDYDPNISIDSYSVDYDFYINEASSYIEDVVNADTNWEHIYEEECFEEDFDIQEIVNNSNAKIKPAQFRLSKSSYYYNKEENVVYRGIGSIKYVNKDCGDTLYEMGKKEYSSFVDLLIDITENTKINSRQIESLIMLNYFKEFGNNGKLMTIFEEFTKGKNKYSKTLKCKDDRKRFLQQLEKETNNNIVPISKQLDFESKLLKDIHTTYDIDKKFIYITDIDTKYAPKLSVYCLANGKKSTLKVEKGRYAQTPIQKGDLIYCENFNCKPATKFVDGKYVEIPDEKIWWLMKYRKVNPEEIEKNINVT